METRTSIILDPANPATEQADTQVRPRWYGWAALLSIGPLLLLFLKAFGQFDQTMLHNSLAHVLIAVSFGNQRRYDDVIVWVNKALDRDPRHLFARELLSAERGDRLQNPVVRPAVVFVEQLNVIFIHGEAWLTLFVWGTLPCLAYSARPEMWHFWHLGDCPRDDALGKNPLRRVTR